MSVTANWDGHQWDDAGALSLPERVVHAAQAAIEGAASDIYTSPLGDKVDGFAVDLARMGGAALIDALAEALKQRIHCRYSDGLCVKCRLLQHQVREFRLLAQHVRDVPALKAV